MSFLSRLKVLFGRHQYHEEIKRLKAEGQELDTRIQELERCATANGDTDWFLGKLKRDPSCALKVLRECDKNAE
jgi:hypothetical protein